MKGKYPELDLIYHVPNEGKRSKIAGAILKALGLKRGVPDLCLPVARGKWHSLYIEMKADGGKPTVEQNQWLCKLRAQGHRCIVAWSFEYARDFIEWYLNIKENENVVF
ncbi:MAG: VRR-NUC domain-containing protein [Clostridia bacterium]|nr:VRR-NUC domain-containing protein [Clostridia bacterium]